MRPIPLGFSSSSNWVYNHSISTLKSQVYILLCLNYMCLSLILLVSPILTTGGRLSMKLATLFSSVPWFFAEGTPDIFTIFLPVVEISLWFSSFPSWHGLESLVIIAKQSIMRDSSITPLFFSSPLIKDISSFRDGNSPSQGFRLLPNPIPHRVQP